jgi:hypothetical protein
MVDAINTGNPVVGTFKVNKYDDIDGKRANQETPRGRLCFRDSNGRMTLPRNISEANRALFPVDWAKPLNPPPYYEGPGLNGQTLYPMNDGSLDVQETDFAIDPDTMFSTPWPAAIKVFELPPALYNLPVTSGNKVLVYDGGTFTYGSGAFVGSILDYVYGEPIFTAYTAGNEGKITLSGGQNAENIIGFVENINVFGTDTVTVKLKGRNALNS